MKGLCKTSTKYFFEFVIFLTDVVRAISGQLSPLNVLQLGVLNRTQTTVETSINVSSAHAPDYDDSKYDLGENRTHGTSVLLGYSPIPTEPKGNDTQQ